MAIHVDRDLLITQIPRECVEDCSHPGSVDADVAYWREALGLTVDRMGAIDCLTGYGAWSRAELEAKTDDDLAEIILWCACGNFHEYIVEAEAEGIDPFGERPEDFETSCGSDIFTLD